MHIAPRKVSYGVQNTLLRESQALTVSLSDEMNRSTNVRTLIIAKLGIVENPCAYQLNPSILLYMTMLLEKIEAKNFGAHDFLANFDVLHLPFLGAEIPNPH